MTNQTATTNRDIYAEADRIVYLAIRARLEKSATTFLFDLANATQADQRARAKTTLGEYITNREATLDELREERDHITALRDQAERACVSVRTPEAMRPEWRAMLRTYTAKREAVTADINRIRAELADLYKRLELTASDREDLVQEACIALLTVDREPAEITAPVLASYGVETAEELTEEERAEAQERANFRYCVNAVGKAINRLASPEALNRNTTTKREASPEEVRAWLDLFGGMGADFKRSTPRKRARASDCFETLELRKNSKGAEVPHIVTHYKTTAPYIYIENYTADENGETDAQYLRSYDPFAQTIGAREALQDFETALNLTDRDRLFLAEFRKACRFYDFKEAKAHAWERVGITNEATQRKAFERLKNRIREAVEANEALTADYGTLIK